MSRTKNYTFLTLGRGDTICDFQYIRAEKPVTG
jgi:hypothetical protein